jgi:hypothetical protein
MASPSVKHPSASLLVIALLVGLPLSASANAGTPLMWAAMLHLVFGNAIIGIGEGLLIAWVFKLHKGVCILAMLAANYFSAWIGGWFLNSQITAHLPLHLYSAWHWIWAMALFTFLLTLILEWPFVLFCFRKEPNRLKRSGLANLLVNSLSYVVLFGWYWSASGVTLYTKTNVVPLSEINLPKQGWIYFISETNTVRRLDLSSQQAETISILPGSDKDERLLVRQSVVETNNWDILASSKTNVVCSNLPVTAAVAWGDADGANRITGTWFNFGEATKLAEGSDWSFQTDFWPIEGFRGQNQKTGEAIRFSLETPFVNWIARNAAHLPGDIVVFQLGENQICLFEVATKKIALLTKGRGPVVVLPK